MTTFFITLAFLFIFFKRICFLFIFSPLVLIYYKYKLKILNSKIVSCSTPRDSSPQYLKLLLTGFTRLYLYNIANLPCHYFRNFFYESQRWRGFVRHADLSRRLRLVQAFHGRPDGFREWSAKSG